MINLELDVKLLLLFEKKTTTTTTLIYSQTWFAHLWCECHRHGDGRNCKFGAKNCCVVDKISHVNWCMQSQSFIAVQLEPIIKRNVFTLKVRAMLWLVSNGAIFRRETRINRQSTLACWMNKFGRRTEYEVILARLYNSSLHSSMSIL